MGSVYLKRYLDRVQEVPAYLRRHLALIRDLDEKVQHMQQEIELNSKKQSLTPDKKNKHHDLETAVTKLVSLADEKVTIAAQVYDFIDKHIQSLDEDLIALDSEIAADKDRLGLGENDTALDAKASRGRGRGVAAADAVPEKKRRGRKRAHAEGEVEEDVAAVHMMPAENEPVYCYCQKPSHGAMVACDHDECSLEWFHYECVGLTAAPVGEWFCPHCVPIMNEKRGK